MYLSGLCTSHPQAKALVFTSAMLFGNECKKPSEPLRFVRFLALLAKRRYLRGFFTAEFPSIQALAASKNNQPTPQVFAVFKTYHCFGLYFCHISGPWSNLRTRDMSGHSINLQLPANVPKIRLAEMMTRAEVVLGLLASCSGKTRPPALIYWCRRISR